MKKTTLAAVPLPLFGREAACPEIPVDVYRARLERTRARLRRCRLDVLAVYGDREHCANLAFLTGFDPRFEEALLLLAADGRNLLLAGNECMGYLPDPALGIATELFQDFSLPGQPRDCSRPLRTILRAFGLKPGTRVGCAGWKSFDGRRIPARALDVPSYLADLLRGLCGAARVSNAAGLFIDPRDGLRIVNEPEQIAQFEYAACVSSDGVLALLRHLAVGKAEHDLERYLDSRGLPLTCHRMIGFGDKARRGLASPSANRARLGDAFTTALGVVGSLTARAGMVAAKPADLKGELRDFYPRYVANYFDVVAAWYRSLRVGVRAGDVFRAADRARDPRLFSFAVNPGHHIGIEEWVHSPFCRGSDVVLRSGMALQADIIPISRGPFCCSNAEDGVILADEALRDILACRYPALWRRVVARRAFMQRQIGINLDESVLPLSNIPAWLPPYALDLGRVLTRKAD